MKFSFRTSLLGLIFLSVAVSIVMTLALLQRYRQIERSQFLVGENSIIIKDLEFLSSGADQVLTLADLVFGSGATYLAEELSEELGKLKKTVIEFKEHPLLESSHTRLDRIEQLISEVELLASSAVNDINRPTQEYPKIDQLDELTLSIVEGIEGVFLLAERDAMISADLLARKREQLKTVSWLAFAFYLVFIFAIFRWATTGMILPIEQLTGAAREAMESESEFKILKKGPSEIQRMSASIEAFIGQLEEKVAKRTHELAEKTKALEHEIKERCSIQESLIESKNAAERASRAKSEFLTNVSHEIRTPMNGIIGFTRMLSETRLTPKQEEYCRMLNICTETLLQLINDTLDLSKIEAGKMVLENSDFDLDRCIRDSFDLVQPRAWEKGLDYSLAISPSVPRHARGDDTRIRQILINILGNAVKFTDEGSVTCSVEATSDAANGNQVTFVIKDTGIGIDDSEMELIFEPFHQESGNPGSTEGTGIGLAISQRLVTLMGGEIEARSTKHEGTTFTFSILLDHSDSADEKTSTGSQPDSGRTQTETALTGSESTPSTTTIAQNFPLEILVAEDNEINQRIITHLLNQLGYQPTITADGPATLKAFEKRHYDVILLDIMMPRLNGMEVATRIRENDTPQVTTPKIIALTANVMQSDRERYEQAGMDGFLSKPVHPDQLQETLETCFRSLAENRDRADSLST